MKSKLFAAAFLLVSVAASAQSMNAEQFYRRAAALQNKGALAIFSQGEIKALMQEAQAAGKRARDNHIAVVKAGQAPRYCAPDHFRMDDKEFMARLTVIPATDRERIDMTGAMTRVFAAKFPCRT
jgi:hypothetical protein